ncbi:hypothetical protein ACFVH6_29915 [Spirillospora sp. NPDC127200]
MSREESAGWLLARRYAVPRWMIEEAAERRSAGDWRGACVGVDVEIDPAHLTSDLEDDLRHLAPDLLRRHLPRVPQVRLHLPAPDAGAGRVRRPHAATPRSAAGRAQRLRLRLAESLPSRYGPAGAPVVREDWSGLRHLWDARRAGELLAHCGGGDRPPFLHADGTPRAADESGRTPLHNAVWNRASAERVRALLDAGARTDVVDGLNRSLRDMINICRYGHLRLLRDRVARQHPEIGSGEPDHHESDG